MEEVSLHENYNTFFLLVCMGVKVDHLRRNFRCEVSPPGEEGGEEGRRGLWLCCGQRLPGIFLLIWAGVSSLLICLS